MDDTEIRSVVLSEIAAMDSDRSVIGLLSEESIYWSSFRQMCKLPKDTPEYFAAIEFHTRVSTIYEECMVKHMHEKIARQMHG